MTEKIYERLDDEKHFNVVRNKVTGDIYEDAAEIAEIMNNLNRPDEEIECIEKTCEYVPKLGFYISDEAPLFFRELHSLLDHEKGILFMAFEMGSIRLDISDPQNWIEVNRTHICVYNNDTGETSVIKTDKVTGFIYEPVHEEELDPEEELREALGLE